MTKLPINDSQLKKLVEARIFIADEPITIKEIIESVLTDYAVSRPKVKQIIALIEHDYLDRGVNLIESGGAYCFQTCLEINEPLSAAISDKPANYSKASLEILAIIAYKQPITKAEIEEIRGVGVSKEIMKKFSERDWVRVVGHKEMPGRPNLYGTTNKFLQDFDLKAIQDLPELQDVTSVEIMQTNEQLSMRIEEESDEVDNEQGLKLTDDEIEREFGE